ncbi:MAG TPA: FAD-linked oxidase C-terminal domain-containing protein [Vicinamibacterales bacterium]
MSPAIPRRLKPPRDKPPRDKDVPSTIIPLPLSSHAKPIDTFADARALEAELRRVVRGEVRFDAGSRALYAADASNYRQIPIGLVVPRDADDVIAAVAACRRFDAPILPRGAGTSLAGQSCNVAVVIDFTKYMNRIVGIDAAARTARVQPGVVLDTLRDRAEREHRLTFGPDPSTHSRCTLGGMIGNNSCGTHSLLSGKTVDNVETLRVLLYDGTEMTVGRTGAAEFAAIVREGGRRAEIYQALARIRDTYAPLVRARFPDIPRRVSGYNLDQLLPENDFHVARSLVGSEGTCAIVLEATVNLIHSPQQRTLVGLGYDDVYLAAEDVLAILELSPIGLEGFEGAMVEGLRKKGAANLDLLPDGGGILLVEFGTDDAQESRAAAERLIRTLTEGRLAAPRARLYTAGEAAAVWRLREAGPRAAANQPGAPPRWEGWDDAAVAPEKLAPYLRDLRRLLDEFRYQATYYGHFGHGCIHMQVSFDLQSEPGIRKYGEFVERAADLVVAYGGSISGEHGDGQSRGALLPRMFGEELMTALRDFKSTWDPANKLNPHKLVDAYLPTENLRLGADYRPLEPATRFRFPDDGGSLAKAALRCIGLGACRKQDSGAMCPSYMVTLEEEHSTRGRAHLLFEMLQGEAIRGGWQDEHVKASLDLCLSCKACKSECPTNVDLATYRAEFLSHYYEGRRRPLHAWAFGFIDRWARLASNAPRLANALARTPGISQLVRRMLQMAPQRTLPRFAPVSFRQWATKQGVATVEANRGREGSAANDRDVVLWVDTFNNYFHPRTSEAALAVLTRGGFNTMVPSAPLCCGRPLYEFGLLDDARRYLQRILDTLRPEIEAGVPIVVLEPSCASVFRDELRNLFPADPLAERLRRQTVLLSEFLLNQPGYEAPRLSRRVMLHGHCHHKAVMKMSAEESLLRKTGADLQPLDAGCCGMAGPFGFAAEHYAMSQSIGERVLLPAVRQAAPDTLIVADGFSCREQIVQATGREALHLADVLNLAARD